MIARIITCDEVTYQLPELLECSVCCTGGVPGDSFSATCIYTPEMAQAVHRAASFLIWEGDWLLLHGIVDEYTIEQSGRGRTVSFQGRGYICRLLDNESRSVTYQTADLREILRNHVIPYGIPCNEIASVKAAGSYTVSAGKSQWSVLTDFCETYGGFLPRFARSGEMFAVPENGGAVFSIGNETTLLSLTKRGDHYGVLSEVVVVDKTRGVSYVVKNQDFIDRCGVRRRIIYTPGQSTWAAMRYTGEYQIARSKENEVEITVVLPGLQRVDAADTVCMQRDDCGIYGEYRVAEVEHRLDETGEKTLLTLKERI